MTTTLEIITVLLALVGVFDLVMRFRHYWRESIWISLKSCDDVLNWQCAQIAQAAYVSAKKLYRLSKQLPEGKEKHEALQVAKEYVQLRRRLYSNLKNSGFQRDEFITLSRKADEILSKITGHMSTGAQQSPAGDVPKAAPEE